MGESHTGWRGGFVALATPFTKDGAIDIDGFAANIPRVESVGVRGVLVSGCTGEFWALTDDERAQLFQVARSAVSGDTVVLAGVGAITTDQTVRLAKAAESAGVHGVFVLPPFFVKPTRRDLVEHYRRVAAETSLPVLLYNIPGNAVNALTPDLVDELADIDGVVGIKESSCDFNNFYKTLVVASDRIDVFVGPSTLFGVAAIVLGSPGFMDTTPQYFGREAVALYEMAASGDIAQARELQQRALQVKELMNANGRNQYASIKAAMNYLGWDGGYPRPPLRPLSDSERRELEAGLEALSIARAPS